MKRLIVVVFISLMCLINTIASAGTIISPKETQMINEFNLPIPNENRNIRLRFSQPQKTSKKPPQLVIIATGLYSYMDKESQKLLAKSYQKAGFATLQFNFMAHGKDKNKSDGDMQNVTVSSGIKDLKAVWDYAKQNLSHKVNTHDIIIAANSYGAIVSLIALEQKIISPESMILVAPFSLRQLKSWCLPFKLFAMLMPNLVVKMLKIPVHPALIRDLLRYHRNAISTKNLLGRTAIHFFVGADDKIASGTEIKKWCEQFNSQQPANIPFIDNVQAHYKIYKGIPHFEIPINISNDINKRSIDFIKKTHDIRS